MRDIELNICDFINIDRYTLKRAKNAFRKCKQSLKRTYKVKEGERARERAALEY